MVTAELKSVHISQIQIGDTIEHKGFLLTVSGNNIKKDTFMGTTLFGDSYKLGSIPVKKVVAWVKK